MNTDDEERYLSAIESIADSLKMIAEKPVPGIVLELSDSPVGYKQADMVRDLVLADEGNRKVPRFCSFCGMNVLVSADDVNPLCEEHKGAEL